MTPYLQPISSSSRPPETGVAADMSAATTADDVEMADLE